MSDLYHYPRPPSFQHNQSFSSSLPHLPQPPAHAAPAHHQQQQQQQQPPTPAHTSSPDEDDHQVTPTPPPPNALPKPEGKPQATFLTKLYALLERPENQHMIRWDAEGKHIIVERPEQLALHVLPSIYRQSRFASFSRQLNIYGFMRKVNLRNVDPSIDDPDASTWSHPTLDRNSPPDVVANFKRRVPPRLPKPRKRPDNMGDPNAAGGMVPPRSMALGVPLTVPSSISVPSASSNFQRGRTRGYSAPGPFTPLPHNVPGQWAPPYPQRQALPPLTVPTDSPPHMQHFGNQSHTGIPPITPQDDVPQGSAFSPTSYSATGSSAYSGYSSSGIGSHAYGYTNSDSSSNWSFPPLSSSSNSSSSHSNLSSLLNPPGSYGPRPTIQTSYTSHHQPYSSLTSNQSPVSLSPDSRPATGYSAASSMSSMAYDPASAGGGGDYDSRPGSSHHARPLTPLSRHSPSGKPSYPPNSSLSVRRERRHSHAVSPYPSPYENIDGRPMTAPGHPDSPPTGLNSIPRVKSLMSVTQSPSESGSGYGYPPGQGEFAYSGGTSATSDPSSDRPWMPSGQEGSQGLRPSTSTSSLSTAASHSSTEHAANTPPAIMDSGRFPEPEIDRFLNQSRPDSGSSTHMD